MASLEQVLKENQVSIFSEIHNDPSLIQKYHAIFKAAAAAGIKDAMVEMPPGKQSDVNAAYNEYSQFIATAPDQEKARQALLGLLNDPRQDKQDAEILLAAAYGLKLHAVDVGNRTDIDVFRSAMEYYREFSDNDPGKNHRDFLAALTPAQLSEFSVMAGRPITAEDVNSIVVNIAQKGIPAALKERVSNGDPKIANLMLEEADGKKFIAIFGRGHGSQHDEVKDGYLQGVDLDGALRLALGANQVTRIDISTPHGAQEEGAKPNYRLDIAGDYLLPVEPVVPSIPKDVQSAAREKYSLPSR